MRPRSFQPALRSSLLSIATVLLSSCMFAQDEVPATTPIFRTRSELVLVPVIVTDERGVPVNDLTKVDFQLFDSGHRRELVSVDLVQRTAVHKNPPSPIPASFFSNLAEAKESGFIVLLIDSLNSTSADQSRAKALAAEMLSKGPVLEPIAVMHLDTTGLHVLQDFTRDADAVRRAVLASPTSRTALDMLASSAVPDSRVPGIPFDHLRVDGDLRTEARFNRMRLDEAATTTLRAMLQLADAFSGLSGRKSLLWMTGGLSYSIGYRDEYLPHSGNTFRDDQPSSRGESIERAALARRAWLGLSKANVAVYPIDSSPVGNPGYLSAELGDRKLRVARREMQQANGLKEVAELTGGRYCPFTEELGECVAAAQTDSENYYQLSYAIDTSKMTQGWHPLQIKLGRPGTKVRARSGYFVAAQRSPGEIAAAKHADLAYALSAPLDYTDIAVSLSLTGSRKVADGSELTMKIAIDPASLGGALNAAQKLDLSIIAAGFEADGRPAGESSKQFSGVLSTRTVSELNAKGIVIDDIVTVGLQARRLRIIVMDNQSGKIGSVRVPLSGSQRASR